jgi:hypothetical protein
MFECSKFSVQVLSLANSQSARTASAEHSTGLFATEQLRPRNVLGAAFIASIVRLNVVTGDWLALSETPQQSLSLEMEPACLSINTLYSSSRF